MPSTSSTPSTPSTPSPFPTTCDAPDASKAVGGSLRLRLLAGTLAWMVLTIALVGVGLRALFQDHIIQQLHGQLVIQLDHLSGALDWSREGQLSMTPLAGDPRWNQPLSGLYWQIDRLGSQPQPALERSRSLWDQVLPTPTPGQVFEHLHDAQGRSLWVATRVLELPDDAAPPLRLVVAADEALLAEPLQRFTHLLWIALGLLALGLALAVALQLHLALQPLRLLHQRLAQVRGGQAAQLHGPFPLELAPLVAQFNHVLTENADMVQRARTQAGNLAHAVHTPLSILANAAAQDGNRSPLALLVGEQVAMARRQVDYHLARARAAAAVRATGLATAVPPVLQALLRTMTRLHTQRGIAFIWEMPPQESAHGPNAAASASALSFRGEEQDLYELLGNLIDNAGKSARTQVQVAVQRRGTQLHFTIDDDGPGIAPELRQRMFTRGVQLDEQRPGSGLGLDIVRTLADTYGGSVQVLDAPPPLNGARLLLILPAAWA